MVYFGLVLWVIQKRFSNKPVDIVVLVFYCNYSIAIGGIIAECPMGCTIIPFRNHNVPIGAY